MEVLQSTLEQKISGVKAKFEQLAAQRSKEIEKGKVINQNISAFSEEMILLQGENRALVGLKDNGQPKKPDLVIPKKKTKKN